MKKEFSMVIVAKHLFDGHRFWKDGGYVCIDEGKIKQMGKGQVTEEVILKSEHVICFDKELVMPGIIDTHTFFPGLLTEITRVRRRKRKGKCSFGTWL